MLEHIHAETERTLEKVNIQVRKMIAKDLFSRGVVTAKEVADYILTELETFLWKEPYTIKYPENWFQAFKEQFFPDWLLKKYPVKYMEIECECWYPTLQIHNHSPILKIKEFDSTKPFIER